MVELAFATCFLAPDVVDRKESRVFMHSIGKKKEQEKEKPTGRTSALAKGNRGKKGFEYLMSSIPPEGMIPEVSLGTLHFNSLKRGIRVALSLI